MKTKKSFVTVLFTLVMLVVSMCSFGITSSAAEYENVEPASVSYYGVKTSDDDTGIASFIDGYIGKIKAIAYAIAGIAVVAVAIIFITGGSQGLQKGKGMAISILVGVAVLALGTGILSSLYDAASGDSGAVVINAVDDLYN
jgi:hypothetical protein